VLKHVLEHLGRDPIVYLEIMKELYRVCEDGATIRVVVPHHRHEFFNSRGRDDPPAGETARQGASLKVTREPTEALAKRQDQHACVIVFPASWPISLLSGHVG
jgi:hypothetical protein